MNGVTAQRALEFGVPQQQDGENEQSFRARVAHEIRQKGYIIEAHEAMTDKLYDDPTNRDGIMGIMGSVACAMQDRHYGGDRIANEFAAGIVASEQRSKEAKNALLMMAMAMGGTRR